jgi:hypothetical protein
VSKCAHGKSYTVKCHRCENKWQGVEQVKSELESWKNTHRLDQVEISSLKDALAEKQLSLDRQNAAADYWYKKATVLAEALEKVRDGFAPDDHPNGIYHRIASAALKTWNTDEKT